MWPGTVLSALRKPRPQGGCCYPPHLTDGETEARERSPRSPLRTVVLLRLGFGQQLRRSSPVSFVSLAPAPSTQAAGGGQ